MYIIQFTEDEITIHYFGLIVRFKRKMNYKRTTSCFSFVTVTCSVCTVFLSSDYNLIQIHLGIRQCHNVSKRLKRWGKHIPIQQQMPATINNASIYNKNKGI